MSAAERMEESLRWSANAVGLRTFREVRVVEECASTMDLALTLSAGEPGLALFSLRQTGGRGRLGRAWVHRAGLGIAATFVLDGGRDGALLSIQAGLATLSACVHAMGWDEDDPPLGLRWPNDVVERPLDGSGSRREFGGPWRKLAGVLIERRGGLTLVGVGINVLHGEEDFPPELRRRATSLAMMRAERGGTGEPLTLERVAGLLLTGLDSELLERPSRRERAAQAWTALDVLRGTTQVFEHDGRRYSGVVEQVDPLGQIVLRSGAGQGERVELPALTTSLVHEV